MATIDVVVFFVGLTTFSDGIPNDCGVKAILPRIQQQQTKQAHVHARVEDHQAALIFETASYVGSTNWKKYDLKVKKGEKAFSYVLLDRDRVRFITNGATNETANLGDIQLPRLPQICDATSKLRRDFMPPYTGAAAVFDIPEGSLKACLSTARDKPAAKRLDTKIRLKTEDSFVISASTMKQTKELRLKSKTGALNVAVANVPTRYLRGDYSVRPETAADGMPHVHAYYGMGDGNISSCTRTLQDWWDTEQPDVEPCDIPVDFRGIGGTPSSRSQEAPFDVAGALPPKMLKGTIYNFECSNTKWP
jgi:hypothetical protein